MKGELTITERVFASGLILDIKGDLTKDAEETLLHLRNWTEIPSGTAHVILNLSEVQYINSSGIAILIRLAQLGMKSGFMIYAFGVNTHYQKMFRLIGLTDYMMLYPDEYSLMQRFQ